MRKVPHLRLTFSSILRLTAMLTVGAALACGHFRTPTYSPQGEFSTPDEYMEAEDVKRNMRPYVRGPFRMQWPVEKPKLSRGFVEAGHGKHSGLDLVGRKNEPIFAAHDGLVIYAGQRFRGYGKMIILEYDQNWATLYGHLNQFKVKTGQEVKAGQIIGTMGRTGRATGVHLHFEVLKSKIPVDPSALFDPNHLASSQNE